MENNNKAFESKWASALKGGYQEERSVFVPQGYVPHTQRQFILFREFELIAEIAKKHGVKTALEIGCGRGTMALYLNRYFGVRVAATDISEDAVALAKENFALHNGEGDILRADAARLPFADDSFDMTMSVGLLEHVPDYMSLLREQYRVLKKGGVLVSINIPKKASVQALNRIYRAARRIAHHKEEHKKDYFRTSETPAQYAAKARAAGFTDVYTFHANPFPIFTPVSQPAEQRLAALYERIFRVRDRFLQHPFKSSALLSQEHFMVGVK
ncbi:MAG: class I SAM-dependent methyltransferase [Parcubacteria group bacterium]|nr:class I SAM-dependent methyltransferase [Parcubacteria group bacterium]